MFAFHLNYTYKATYLIPFLLRINIGKREKGLRVAEVFKLLKQTYTRVLLRNVDNPPTEAEQFLHKAFHFTLPIFNALKRIKMWNRNS